jgi:hypothetical protein
MQFLILQSDSETILRPEDKEALMNAEAQNRFLELKAEEQQLQFFAVFPPGCSGNRPGYGGGSLPVS